MSEFTFTELGEGLEKVDISLVEANIAAKTPKDPVWDVPEGEELDVEQELYGLNKSEEEVPVPPAPVLEESAEEAPSNLLPPDVEGKPPEYVEAVEAYKWAQAHARWPKMLVQYEIQMGLLLTAAQEALNEESVIGDITVITIDGDPEEGRQSAILLNTWIACLRMFTDYPTVAEDTDGGVRLVIKR